jgi:hypothetical protein
MPYPDGYLIEVRHATGPLEGTLASNRQRIALLSEAKASSNRAQA